jgi:hypothetical protein
MYPPIVRMFESTDARPRARCLPPALFGLLVSLAACDSVSESTPAHTADGIEDRSPIRIVEQQASHGPDGIRTLRQSRRFGDTLSFAYIRAVRVVGDYVLVADREMDPHLTLLDRRDGAIVSRFGRDGEGPGEFRNPAWIVPSFDGPPVIWVFDFGTQRFTALRIGADATLTVAEERRFNPPAPVQNPIWLDGRVLTNGLFSDFTLLLAEGDGTPLSRIRTNPPFTDERLAHPVGRYMANRNWLAATPSGDRFVLAYQFDSRIDVFNRDATWSVSARGPRPVTPSFRVTGNRFFWNDENEMAYRWVAATERYVYALFCGCKKEEEDPSTTIQVFRWDGTFVDEFTTEHPLTAFDVTPDDSTLYGGYEAPHPFLGEWHLPAYLKGD